MLRPFHHAPVLSFTAPDGYNGKTFQGVLVLSSDGVARFQDKRRPFWYLIASPHRYQNAEEVRRHCENKTPGHFPPAWIVTGPAN
jgi:hypothetical protein